MKLIFRKELFVNDMKSIGVNEDAINDAIATWATACDGKEVVESIITLTHLTREQSYIIHSDWCEKVEE